MTDLRDNFTYLSPFGRLTVGLITTMRIPRNDRFVFLDKVSIFRSQCGGYVRAVRGTNGCPRHFQQTDVEVRRETFVSGFQFSLQILCIFTLRRIYLARKVYRALTLRLSRQRVTIHFDKRYVYFDPNSSSSMVTLLFGMVTLLISMQSYFNSSTSLEKESVKMPPQTSNSCRFCCRWDEPEKRKSILDVVYEVRRTMNSLISINETGYLRTTHSQLLRIENLPVDTISWSSPSDTLVCEW